MRKHGRHSMTYVGGGAHTSWQMKIHAILTGISNYPTPLKLPVSVHEVQYISSWQKIHTTTIYICNIMQGAMAI